MGNYAGEFGDKTSGIGFITITGKIYNVTLKLHNLKNPRKKFIKVKPGESIEEAVARKKGIDTNEQTDEKPRKPSSR